jgi:hypothetical protein
MEKSGIRLASYWTEVLPKVELERKLHEAVIQAHQRLAQDESRKHPLEKAKEQAMPARSWNRIRTCWKSPGDGKMLK